MKTTKKILSVLLAVIMMFSFAAVAFAADGEAGEIGKTYSVELKKGETKTFTFTAENDGFCYVDAVTLNDFSACVSVSSANYEVEDLVSKSGSFEPLCLILSKNEKFTVEVYNGHIDDVDIKVEFTVNQMDGKALYEGENTVDSDFSFFIFTPEKDGLYNFRSSDIGELCPYIEMYEKDNYIGSNYGIGYEDDYNFDFTAPLEAGKTYLVYIACDEADGETEPFTVTVSYNKEIKAEELYFPMLEREDDLVFYSNGIYSSNFFITPSGAEYSDEITVTVGNEKILKAEVTHGNNLDITTFRAGKTTITFSTESGLEKTFTIKVQPQFIRVLLSWLNSIKNFFSRIFNF